MLDAPGVPPHDEVGVDPRTVLPRKLKPRRSPGPHGGLDLGRFVQPLEPPPDDPELKFGYGPPVSSTSGAHSAGDGLDSESKHA